MKNHLEEKKYISNLIGNIKDKSIANILRGIIFNDKNDIDWNKVTGIIKHYHPENK